MTSAGTGVARACDSCNFVDEQMSFLREETKKRGFPTVGRRPHGPVRDPQGARAHHRPGRLALRLPGLRRRGAAVDRPHRRRGSEDYRTQALRNFEQLAAWEQCNDCAFIPVCAGGCTVAAHNELGDMHAPNCHKPSFEPASITLAHEAARELATA